ncbi:hypothetical protein PFISCL1PPCAC_19822 [Pristionchus fissidentatus]|uniref:Uncharacterized protein n=1 Tax=Pristionchus fissidentatus TaxID=1538716 RepID=A0AAV5WD16_9BILA|nr:hypothetical protein PFISCL1PPCAC_19822 [Pristionchus fissidentatus]
MGEKQKGRGTAIVPSTEHKMTKLTTDFSDDANLQKLIKKVIETTRCSVSQAEVALLDNENDVQSAVLYILDRNGQVDCWTEQKSRKAKKEEQEKEFETARRTAAEASISRRGGRGASAPRLVRGTGYVSRGTSLPRGGPITRGGGAFSRGGYGARPGLPSLQVPTEGNIEGTNTTIFDDVDWKNGPLVYESSSVVTAAAATPPAANIAPLTAAGPMSFAAMAKKATAPPAPPPVAALPPPPEEPEIVPDELAGEEVLDSSLETTVPEPTSEEPTPEPTIEEIEEREVVAQSWTEELKSNLGIGLEEEKRSLRQRVEFIDTAGAAPLSEYQFGFCAPDPQPLMPSSVNVPSPQEPSFNRIIPPQQTQPIPPQIQSLPTVQPQPPHAQEESVKTSPPSFSRGLSYETTSSMAYPPSENRTMLPPRTQTQPVAQQTAHSSMFPPQMAPYASYAPYMNMYSPVGGGMRADDPYTAAMMQYPFPGLGQIDLSGILPQGALSSQNAAPPRSEHSDMNKYGGVGGRSDSVAPPPGFTSNAAPFMAQQSLSSLLVQPQYPNHPFASFMMPSVNANRYEEERRAKESRSTHQSHNTPPPHMGHYSHHQQSNTGAYGSLHKKPQYGSNNWNNN